MVDDSPGETRSSSPVHADTVDEQHRELRIAIIAAVAANGVIGADGAIPWEYPADLRHFKETTMGHPVILGRRTFEAITDRLGGPLPGRTNIVLTTTGVGAMAKTPDHVVVEADGVPAAIAVAAERGAETAYVAGGATVYDAFLPLADELVLTEIPERPAGDTYFPHWDPDEWVERSRQQAGALAFVTYERASPPVSDGSAGGG